MIGLRSRRWSLYLDFDDGRCAGRRSSEIMKVLYDEIAETVIGN